MIRYTKSEISPPEVGVPTYRFSVVAEDGYQLETFAFFEDDGQWHFADRKHETPRLRLADQAYPDGEVSVEFRQDDFWLREYSITQEEYFRARLAAIGR
jgi:hypothetical protein